MKPTLNLQQILALERALEHYFLNELGIEGPKVVDGKWTDIEKVYTWNNSQECRENVLKLTGAKDIREASKKLQDLKDEVLKGAEAPRSTDQTLPQDLEEKIKKEEIRSEKLKKTRDEAKADVDTATKRQQELQAEAEKLKQKIEELKKEEIVKELKDKKIYAKVEVEEKDQIKLEQLDQSEQQKIKHLEDLVSKGKIETVKKELALELEKKAKAELVKQGFSESEIREIANETAEETIETLSQKSSPNYIPSSYQTAILATVAVDKTTTPKIVASKTAEELIKKSAGNIAVFKIQPEVITREILKTAFGDNFTTFILGVDPTKVKVTLTESLPTNVPQQELQSYKEVNLENIRSSQINIHQGQISVIDKITSLGKEYGHSYFSSNITNFISRKIESLPATSVIKKAINTPEMRAIFYAKYGIGQPVVWQYMNPTLMKVMGQNQLAGAFFSAAGKVTGKEIVKPVVASITKEVGKEVAVQATKEVGKKAAGGLMAKIIGTVAGPFSAIPIVGPVLNWLLAEVIVKGATELWSKAKIWWKKNKEVAAVPIAVITAISLARFGMGPALLGGASAYLFFGGTTAALIYGPLKFFGLIGRSIGIAIATPVIVTLLVLPPLVAFIMLVINNSAYVVPPSPLSSSQIADNPYMLVTKTANPSKLDNSNSNQTVIYLVTVTALRNNLTNVKISSSECKVIKKDKTKINCPPEIFPDVNNISIAPGSPYSFTFTGNYDSKYSDSLIYDSITFSAEVDGQSVTTSGSANVCIGDCPTSCAKVSDNAQSWPSNLRSNAENGLIEISKYQGFMSKVCSKNEEINLCYNPSQITAGYFAWHVHNSKGDSCDVYFNNKGIGSTKDASFLITHELTHHVQKINGGETAKYLVSGGWIPEVAGRGFCTYKDTAGSYTEAMAEAAGLYVNIPSWGNCVTNYLSKYPRNYNWAKGFME